MASSHQHDGTLIPDVRMNQWCGINSLAYFLPITFERNIGLSTQLSLIISGILGIQYFLVSWLLVHSLQKAYQNITNILPSPYFFIERLGRRKMLMSSAAACCFCMLMISVMLAFNTTAVGLLILPSRSPQGVFVADN